MTLLKWRVYMHLRKQPTNTCTLYLFNLKWPCLTSNLYSPSFILHSVMEFRGTVWAPLPRRGWGQNTFPLVRPRRRGAIKLCRDEGLAWGGVKNFCRVEGPVGGGLLKTSPGRRIRRGRGIPRSTGKTWNPIKTNFSTNFLLFDYI